MSSCIPGVSHRPRVLFAPAAIGAIATAALPGSPVAAAIRQNGRREEHFARRRSRAARHGSPVDWGH